MNQNQQWSFPGKGRTGLNFSTFFYPGLPRMALTRLEYAPSAWTKDRPLGDDLEKYPDWEGWSNAQWAWEFVRRHPLLGEDKPDEEAAKWLGLDRWIPSQTRWEEIGRNPFVFSLLPSLLDSQLDQKSSEYVNVCLNVRHLAEAFMGDPKSLQSVIGSLLEGLAAAYESQNIHIPLDEGERVTIDPRLYGRQPRASSISGRSRIASLTALDISDQMKSAEAWQRWPFKTKAGEIEETSRRKFHEARRRGEYLRNIGFSELGRSAAARDADLPDLRSRAFEMVARGLATKHR